MASEDPSASPTTTMTPVIELAVAEIEDEEIAETVIGFLDGDIDDNDVQKISEVDLEELPDKAVEAIVEALNEAPDEVKEQVEEEINVFSGELDEYQPSGSNVTVAERRTIVAVTATVASPVSPLPAARRRKV